MTVNNRNTSPANNKDNEAKNKGLILNTENLDNDSVEEILNILQDSNLINSWDFDRTDNNTDTEHNHYYFNSVLDNNSLNSVIENYLSGKDITDQITKMIATKGEIMALTLKGTLDTKSIDFTTDLTEDTKAELLKNVDDFRYITSDNTGATKIKTFSENLGLSRTDKPEVLLTDPSAAKSLQGSFNFEFNFDSELNQEQEEAITSSLNEAFEETFNRYNQGFMYDLNSPHCFLKDNKLQITFNNLFQSATGPEIYMFSKKQVKKDMEVLLKNLSSKADLDIKFSDLKLAVSEDKLKEIMETKRRDSKPQAPKQERQEPVQKVSERTQRLEQESKEMDPNFLNTLFGMKTLKDLEVLLSQLEDTLSHIQAAKEFLGTDIATDKIAEAEAKIELVKTREIDLTKEIETTEKIGFLEVEISAQKDVISIKDDSIKTLTTQVEKLSEQGLKLTEQVEKLTGVVDTLTQENSTLKSKVENLSETLEATEKEFDILEKEFVKMETETTSLKHQIEASKVYTGTLQEKISTLTEEQNTKDLQIARLTKELEISKSKEVSVAEKAGFEVSKPTDTTPFGKIIQEERENGVLTKKNGKPVSKQQARQEAKNKAKKHLDSVKKREDSKKKEDPKKSDIEDGFGDR